MRRAVIDIGTNTVKLLVADVNGNDVVPVLSKDATTRLGEGVDKTKRLLPAAIARTVKTVGEFAAEARKLGATNVRALSTSATRDAENRDEFLTGVRTTCDLEVEVITGQREAELIFRGVSSDPVWSSQPVLVLDVGGGSAEFIQGLPAAAGEAGKIERFQSLPVGAVRLTEKFGEDFPALVAYLRATLYKLLAGYEAHGRKMIGTGGTVTTLARIQSGKVDHASISQEGMRALVARLNALPLAERKKVPGLPPERADIIVAGGAVFVVAMELLGATELTVSVRNLRYGALLV